MNIEQLIEIADQFGGHLPVAVVIEQGDRQWVFKNFDLDDQTIDGEITLAFTVYRD